MEAGRPNPPVEIILQPGTEIVVRCGGQMLHLRLDDAPSPVSHAPKLSDKQRQLLATATTTPVYRKNLVAAAGLRNNSGTRAALAGLIEKGLLVEAGKMVRRP